MASISNGPIAEAPADREGVDLDGAGDAGFLQALADQVRREGSGVDRAFQPGPEVMNGADMVFVGMGDHEADDVVHALFDEGRIDHERLDFGHVIAAEGDAGIDDQPFSGMTVEGHVHADAVAAAEGEKNDLVGAGNRATYGAGPGGTRGWSTGLGITCSGGSRRSGRNCRRRRDQGLLPNTKILSAADG